MGLFDAAKAQTKTLIAQASNKANSLLKLPGVNKDQKVAAANPEPEALVENRDVFLTEGFAQHPTVRAPESTPADFYRKGKLVKQGNNSFYEVLPRFIDEYDEEPASIRVLGKVKNEKVDRDLIPPFTKFLLENVQESHTERSQVVETFGQFYVFFFGERPPVYNFSGTLINTRNINWLSDFMFYYENFLRGTRCVENNARIVLTYSGRQIEGFIMGTNNSTTGVLEKGVQMSFQVLVIDRKILQLSQDFGLVESDGKFAEDKSFIQLLTDAGLSRAEISKAFNSVKKTADATETASSPTPKKASEIDAVKAEFKSIADKIKTTVTGKLKIG